MVSFVVGGSGDGVNRGWGRVGCKFITSKGFFLERDDALRRGQMGQNCHCVIIEWLKRE